MARRDYSAEAELLFKRFADRHGLDYHVATDAPVDVCWKFPKQPKLSLPIVLVHQNNDELNFEVSDFWGCFFPFEQVATRFETILDAWVTGDARIAVTGRRSRLLQVREGEVWDTVYRDNECLWPVNRIPRAFIKNNADW